MLTRYPIFISVALLFLCCSEKVTLEAFDPLDHVDPFIGRALNCDATPGAATPWGMVTMTPQFAADDAGDFEDHSERSKNDHDYMVGFSHTAFTANPTLPIVIMPVFGERRWRVEERRYHYSRESASPGYYKVQLDEDRIFADFTATARTGLSRFRFQNGWAHIVLDLGQNLRQGDAAWVRITAPNEIVGSIESRFCGHGRRKINFVAQFDRTAMGGGVFKGEMLLPESVHEVMGKDVGAVFSFRTLDGDAIQVKVGISFVSIDNARLNLRTEQPSFSFALTRQNARDMWEKELAKISIAGGSAEGATMFYTALYRSLLHPHIFNDVNGEYLLMNNEDAVGTVIGMNRYSLFSLPETYRTLHPLLATLYPTRQLDMVHSMVGMAMESGRLPEREIAHECDDAYGNPAVIVIADTYMRGLHDFDINRAYRAMRQQATPKADVSGPRALAQYDELGYIPYEEEAERQLTSSPYLAKRVCGSVSSTLEYALADWTLAQMAKALGKSEDFKFFIKRSQNYAHLFDVASGFFRARWANGEWLEPFDPLAGLRRSQPPRACIGYRKGSAWNAAFFAPHDMPGLIELYGKDQFITRLQTLFENNYFDPGNEQDMAYPFLFNYVEGEEWRTQKTVREVIARYFSANPDGLPSYNDPGALSAWLVWAMMGLYPDCPASNLYQLSTPFFKRIEFCLDSDYYPGKSFVIETKNLSDDNIYIKSIKLNGKRLESFVLHHDDLVRGGALHIIASRKK